LLTDFKTFAEELKSKIDQIEAANRTGEPTAASGQQGD